MGRVVHFELGADNPARAVKFYETVFGWKVNKWEGPQEYWLVNTGENDGAGINGGIMKRQDPGQHTVNTVGVPSVDEFVKKVTAAGGKIAVPKFPIPGIGYIAYCIDTEGNTFGIIQPDESAK